MVVYYSICFFIFGLIFGSFYNVVGYRLPKKESLVYPSSHCTICNHKLGVLELIPVFSFLFQGGKCKHCKAKISWYYTVFELITGFLFLFSYLRFGFSFSCFMALVLSSILVIIIISDYKYYIIPDELIIVGVVLIGISQFLIGGGNFNNFQLKDAFLNLLISLGNGFGSFLLMYAIKLFGDFLFKKESMGGGDIKLMFVIGMTLGFPMSIISIFVASIIGLPIALILLKMKSTHEIPFGPFLSVATLLLFFLNCSWIDILTIFA